MQTWKQEYGCRLLSDTRGNTVERALTIEVATVAHSAFTHNDSKAPMLRLLLQRQSYYISRKISNIDKSAWVTWGFWFSIEALRRTQRYVVPGGPNRQLARSRCSLLPRCLSCMERSLSNLAILQQRQEQRSNCNTMHPMSSPATCLLGVELQFHAGLLASTSSSTQLRTAESRCGACSRSLFSSQKMSEWLVACGAVHKGML